tara:strand:- start:3063 stop:3311 length:249 start_codon:yes stop_codon:yes gene_type:complete
MVTLEQKVENFDSNDFIKQMEVTDSTIPNRHFGAVVVHFIVRRDKIDQEGGTCSYKNPGTFRDRVLMRFMKDALKREIANPA